MTETTCRKQPCGHCMQFECDLGPNGTYCEYCFRFECWGRAEQVLAKFPQDQVLQYMNEVLAE